MKTATKVFIWLSLIGAVLSIVGVLALPVGQDVEGGGMLAAIGAVPVIIGSVPMFVFGIMALSRLGKATCKADVPTWLGVCVLLFVGLIPGVLMLCLKDEHLTVRR